MNEGMNDAGNRFSSEKYNMTVKEMMMTSIFSAVT